MKANVNDRGSIEAAYSSEAYRNDAARNSVGNASVLHGLTILSQPDAAGEFEMVTAKRQSGEGDPEGDTVFVPPFLESEGGAGDAGYAAYVDRVLELARSVEFKSPLGRDPRLAGFHGG